ncbi:tRNA-binding protein [Candidatus Bathyarchaeota archaeon]|nr:tRNA-binding protein [Candidatus Bathyarchaeota archaeon]
MSVTFRDFSKLDIRVGRVLRSERVPGKDKLFKLNVDIGTSKVEIIAGGGEYYRPEDLVGTNLIVVTNLEPKIIAGIESRGMALAADYKGKPIWLTVPSDVPPGTKVR